MDIYQFQSNISKPANAKYFILIVTHLVVPRTCFEHLSVLLASVHLVTANLGLFLRVLSF